MTIRVRTFAWCFSHGTLHRFEGALGEEWCTANWVPFAAATRGDALAVKNAWYGDAVFLEDLTLEQQVKVLEAVEARVRNSANY